MCDSQIRFIMLKSSVFIQFIDFHSVKVLPFNFHSVERFSAKLASRDKVNVHTMPNTNTFGLNVSLG